METDLYGWAPADTAPRDGTFVDMWHPDQGRVADCRWMRIYPAHIKSSDEHAWFAQSGGRAFRMDGFSHWRSLPPRPIGMPAQECNTIGLPEHLRA